MMIAMAMAAHYLLGSTTTKNQYTAHRPKKGGIGYGREKRR
jgi:hypothetical protein